MLSTLSQMAADEDAVGMLAVAGTVRAFLLAVAMFPGERTLKQKFEKFGQKQSCLGMTDQ